MIDIPSLAERCAPEVGPRTIAAIIRVESNGYPWALNVNGAHRLARQPRDRDEAIRWAKWLIERGYNVDLGLMQVNSNNLASLGIGVRDVLDPCTNIQAGSLILRRFYRSALNEHGQTDRALYGAISAYNTGSLTRGISNGYVGKVISVPTPVPPRGTALAHPTSGSQPRRKREDHRGFEPSPRVDAH